jgi:predicted nucleic acid-binding protein
MRLVFLDTVGLLATWDERDQWHHAAAPVFAELVREKAILFTTEFVLAECANAAARNPYRSRVAVLRDHLMAQNRVAKIDYEALETAWKVFRDDDSRAAGLVDQVSFIEMRRLGVTDAFTNDYHVRAAGFKTLF